jgi:guanine nucleotide-binding protein subunit alpha
MTYFNEVTDGHILMFVTGSGESGKSTIVKQMKIIHQNGYSEHELQLWRQTVYKNIVDSAKALVGALRQFDVEVTDEKNRVHCDYIMEATVDPDPQQSLDPQLGEAIRSLWKDASIPKVMEHQNEFYLMDSAS